MTEATDKPKTPTIKWDMCDINEAKKERILEDNPDMSEDDAMEEACGEDTSIEWEDLMECLSEWMRELQDDVHWHATVKNQGWRNLSGHKDIVAADGKTLLQKLLPDTDCTFTIEKREGYLWINNAHHDKPAGGEIYEIHPRKEDA